MAGSVPEPRLGRARLLELLRSALPYALLALAIYWSWHLLAGPG